MKEKKGEAGYIRRRKRNVAIKTLTEFGLSVALLLLGIWQTGDRLNLLTVVAILGCLPASKSLVEWIMLMPHHSIKEDMAREIEEKGETLTKVYDMVFTSEKKIMPVESIVIAGNTICGYSSKQKIDTNGTAEHIKKYLRANRFSNVSVKIFDNYASYLKRVDEMKQLETEAEGEAMICRLLLNLSL